tara:strand:- start:188 stop:577 length:390 start_codon:yes stop_codon:yes gene_type:complete
LFLKAQQGGENARTLPDALSGVVCTLVREAKSGSAEVDGPGYRRYSMKHRTSKKMKHFFDSTKQSVWCLKVLKGFGLNGFQRPLVVSESSSSIQGGNSSREIQVHKIRQIAQRSATKPETRGKLMDVFC